MSVPVTNLGMRIKALLHQTLPASISSTTLDQSTSAFRRCTRLHSLRSPPRSNLRNLAVPHAAVDPLASQSSLVYDAQHRLLLAPNAGSDTISVFSVRGTALHLNEVISSGGPFPSSIAVHDNIAYVLDAGSSGFVQGYRIDGNRLSPIEGSLRSLSLANSNPPPFLAAPAQVGFTPNGGQLVVTLKGNYGGSVDVFSVSPSGAISAQATTTVVGGNAVYQA